MLELSGHGLDHLVGFLFQVVRVDGLLDFETRHQRSQFVGCLDDRPLCGLQVFRSGNGLSLVSNLIEFLQRLGDLLLNLLGLTWFIGFLVRHDAIPRFDVYSDPG